MSCIRHLDSRHTTEPIHSPPIRRGYCPGLSRTAVGGADVEQVGFHRRQTAEKTLGNDVFGVDGIQVRNKRRRLLKPV